jgi:hypothetical protein
MSSEIYSIYGKVAPNDWRLLNEIYPEFESFSIEFDDFMAAKSALGDPASTKAGLFEISQLACTGCA